MVKQAEIRQDLQDFSGLTRLNPVNPVYLSLGFHGRN
jgi:hypothetical protein